MTSKTQDDERRPLGDHELDSIHGGFVLIDLLVSLKKWGRIILMEVSRLFKQADTAISVQPQAC